MPGKFDIASARTRFPALKEDQVYLDNAGGSQTLDDVIQSCVLCYTYLVKLLTWN